MNFGDYNMGVGSRWSTREQERPGECCNTHPGKGKDYTWTFHKPIEAYVKSLRNAGLLIDAIEEWPSHKTSTSGPRAPAENTARKEIPLFLAIRALKAMPAEAMEAHDAEA